MRYTISYTSSLVLFFLVGAFVATASVALAHDEFAASIDGGKLAPCPSLFKCRVA